MKTKFFIFNLFLTLFTMNTIQAQENDKTFAPSDRVTVERVHFKNRFGITLTADMYKPKNAEGKLAAIAISGPFGAVKEQASASMPRPWPNADSSPLPSTPPTRARVAANPRYVASPDINTEDFCAAVDFLSIRDDVDPERIGILGICGWGGMALNAAAIDTRIKATVTSTMYDMSRVSANGYFDSMDADQRYALRQKLNAQRTIDARNGSYALAGGVVDPLPPMLRNLSKITMAYYKTPRGYHKRSLNSNGGWNVTSALSFIKHASAHLQQ